MLAGVQLALFLWYLNATQIRQPYWDMYSWVLHYLDFRANGEWWSYLWAAHDVHRPVWIRLLTALDVEAFHGVSYPFIVFTAAGHLITATLLWRETESGIGGTAGTVIGMLVLMLLFTSVAAVNCAVPITNGYLHVVTFVVVSVVLFDGGAGTIGSMSTEWRRVLALLAAVSAVFASAVGIAIWPILVFLAWRSQARRWKAIVVLVAVVFMAVYLYGLRFGAGVFGSAQLDVIHELLRRADYLLAYAGLPWTRAAPLAVPGRIVGGVLLAAGTWMVVRGCVRQPATRLERLAIALVMFSLISAAMATLGRVDIEGHNGVLVPVRYAVLLVPLHVGLVWIVAPTFARRWNDRTWWPLASGVLTVVCLLLLVQQVAAGQIAVASARQMRTTIARFVAGQTDPEMTNVIYPDLEQARRELTIIRDAGLYLDAR
jgi:hypothetical protein